MLFCPGGQAEMVHAWKAFLPEGRRELVLHTRHRGFCRWAGRSVICTRDSSSQLLPLARLQLRGCRQHAVGWCMRIRRGGTSWLTYLS